jgi:UDP-sulfoquinovose synthase
MKKNVLMVGGDGFVGWPATLELLNRGHDVVIVDNLLRRKIDTEMNTVSIVPIASIEQRVEAANSAFSSKCKFEFVDVSCEYNRLVKIIKDHNIDTVIHFGEIKSAPYSMIDAEHAGLTVKNNINATANILNAIAFENPNIHLVHMGTMGVYGYKDDFGAIPEGYLDITVKQTGASTSIVFPTDPGSVYHMTKSLDQVMFQFYNKNWKIKITDLHQGIIWGCQTLQTRRHETLANRFDYDGTMGSVLNRFIIEGVIGYPLTVHGTGGQSRAFIHIQDSADCVRRAVENPPSADRVRIFNQVSEVLRVRDLANYVSKTTGTEIQYLDNPRNERTENELLVQNEGLKNLGFVPTLMQDSLVEEIEHIVKNYSHRINKDAIDSLKFKWVKK